MAHHALLIDSDQATAKAAGAALSTLDVVCTACSSAVEARRVFGRRAWDLAVIDPLLESADGLALAGELRERQPGLPLLFVSSVYRGTQVATALLRRFGAPLVTKPFTTAGLVAVAAPLLSRRGLDAAPRASSRVAAFEAELRDRPFAGVLGELYRARASGLLTITKERVRRRVHLEDGAPQFASSNVRGECAGPMQLTSGELTQAQLDLALGRARSEQRPLHEALVEVGALSPGRIQLALKQQTEAVVTAACGATEGTIQFEPGPLSADVPRARQHPLALVIAGVARHYPIASIRDYLQSRVGVQLRASPELAAEAAMIGQLFPGEQVTSALARAPRTLQALEALPEHELPLLLALVSFGLVTFQPLVEADKPAPRLTQPPEVKPVRAGARPLFSAKSVHPTTAHAADATSDGALLARIHAQHARLSIVNHYELLAVSATAKTDELKRAYLREAKLWHEDRFASLDLGPALVQLREIFARLREANETLSDPEARARYDAALEQRRTIGDADPADVAQAKTLMQRALQLERTSRLPEAERQLRRAVELHPRGAELWVALARYSLLVHGRSAVQGVRDALERARALQHEPLPIEVLLAKAEEAEGQHDASEQRLKKILLDHPDHEEAAQLLRQLRERRQQGAKSGGLLGRFLNRK